MGTATEQASTSGSDQHVERATLGHTEFIGYLAGARGIFVVDSDQFDLVPGIGLQLMIDARVVATEGPGADDSDAQDIVES